MLRTGKTPEITVRSAISAPPSFRKLHCGGQKQPNSLVKQIGLIPRRQAAGRSAERAHVAIASQPTPYALPSWSQKTWLALARLRRETRPGERLLALRRRWHEGTADTTLLTPSIRCEAGCRLCFPGSRTRDVICNAAHCRIPLRVNPRQMGSRRLPARQRDRRP